MLQPVSKTYNAAVNGLITDGNDLMSPENSTLDESNYEILRDGTRRRRRAFIEENLRQDHKGVDNRTAHTCYVWKTPGKISNISYLAEQRNHIVSLYRLDHDYPGYMRTNEEFQIDLGMFGDYHKDFDRSMEFPCTYTEGNGSLYIFHSTAGTIKVEYLENGFRCTPVGTWIRDYEGAAESINATHRSTLPDINAIAEYAPGVPYNDPAEALGITTFLPLERAYNLSNTGWDAQGVHTFLHDSKTDYQIRSPLVKGGTITKTALADFSYPAYTDRYLTGRQVDEDGENTFSFKQLIESKDSSTVPPLGSRIGHSSLHPAGTLTNIPNNMLDDVVTSAGPGGLIARIQLTYDERQTHSDGISDDNVAIFVHYMTFEATDAAGKVWQGGFSGVLDGQLIRNATGTTLQGLYYNQYMAAQGFTSIVVTGMYAYPSPTYFPHQIPDNDSSYDFRQNRRPSSGTYFAGRLWQTGDRHSRLYYSQQVEAGTNSGDNRGICRESMCYSAADPTDGFDNKLVATDGGYINLSDSGTHYGLVELSRRLFVLTDNGIWVISGGEAGYFMADSFQVSKISNAEVLGYRAYVVVDNELHVATDEGIIRFTSEGMESLTDQRIRNRFDDLVKGRQVIAAYDPESDLVRWAFPETFGEVDVASRLGVTMLTYHRLHGAWFQYDLPEDYTIVDMCVLPYTAKTETYNKFRYLTVAKNFDVLTLGAPLSSDYSVEAKLGPSGYDEWVASHTNRFRDFRDSTSDPQAVPRESMPAFMVTNHVLYGEGGRFNKINYVVSHNRNVTTDFVVAPDGSLLDNIPGKTMLEGLWDWFDEDHQNKVSKPHETYRFRRSYFTDSDEYSRGEPNLVAKTKIRGRGREFRLRWSTDGEYDSHITGWVIEGQVMGAM